MACLIFCFVSSFSHMLSCLIYNVSLLISVQCIGRSYKLSLPIFSKMAVASPSTKPLFWICSSCSKLIFIDCIKSFILIASLHCSFKNICILNLLFILLFVIVLLPTFGINSFICDRKS